MSTLATPCVSANNEFITERFNADSSAVKMNLDGFLSFEEINEPFETKERHNNEDQDFLNSDISDVLAEIRNARETLYSYPDSGR